MVDGFDPARLARRDLRRLVGELWTDPRCDALAPGVLDAAVAADAKSLDRAVLTAYLRHFPCDHPAFERLRAASALTARRRDWPWRARGAEWDLWDRIAGPERLAKALLTRDDAGAVMREAGLDGDLAQGAFVADAVEAACEQAADASGNEAQALGERLIALFESLAIGGQDAMLAWALLAPWAHRKPPDAYRDRIAKLLVARVGDPRLNAARWEALAAEMLDPDASALVAMMRRWLTDTTVREFFKVVTHTTNDANQWAEREAFWLGYLDAGAIDEAWFALGVNADELIRRTGQESRVDYGLVIGERQYADPSHSSLILSIGDLRIAEWSHSGACRFWHAGDRTAPLPYKGKYFGYQLRAMNGGRDFAYLPHQGRWEPRFAHRIARKSHVQHPVWRDGYA